LGILISVVVVVMGFKKGENGSNAVFNYKKIPRT
jgi:hypothetical protein